MRRLLLSPLFSLFALGSVSPLVSLAAEPFVPVPTLDLKRYEGLWYEQAKIPNAIQKTCASEVTDTYTLAENNRINVVNNCVPEPGSNPFQLEATAKVLDESGSAWKITFFKVRLTF